MTSKEERIYRLEQKVQMLLLSLAVTEDFYEKVSIEDKIEFLNMEIDRIRDEN